MSEGVGYPDWQRVVNWDSPTLAHGVWEDRSKGLSTEALDVSRYANIRLRLHVVAAGEKYTRVYLEWGRSKEEVGTGKGERIEFALAPSGEMPDSEDHVLSLPNLGPWFRLQLGPGAVVEAPEWEYMIWADNRSPQTPYSARMPSLVVGQNVETEIGKPAVIYPNYYFAGAAIVGFYESAKGQYAYLEVINPVTGEWVRHITLGAQVESVYESIHVALPLGAWRVSVGTTGAKTTAGIAVTPSVTGST